jgi:hypothetical protein
MFEQKFAEFLKRQVKEAEGRRLEMLKRDLTGTKILLERVLFPVFGTLDDLVLEYEMVNFSGIKIFGDVFHAKYRIVFEEEHFITHAERVTRERFTFERVRARVAAARGFIYFPYSRDELLEKPEFCRSNLYELLGRIGNAADSAFLELPVYEREVLRLALLLSRPFRPTDVSGWLMVNNVTGRKVIRELESKDLVTPVGGGEKRCYAFKLTEKAVSLLLGGR